MKKTVQIIILMVLITPLFLVMKPSFSYACSCMIPPPPDEALADADYVFRGKVVGIQPNSDSLEVIFDVTESWKGVDQNQIGVYTPSNEASCGYSFVVDEEYLVYAYEFNGSLETYLCTRTNRIADAGEDLNVLGSGETPTIAVDFTEETPNFFNWILTSLYVFLGVAILVGSWLLIRARKKE